MEGMFPSEHTPQAPEKTATAEAEATSGHSFRRRFVFFFAPGVYQSLLAFLALPLTTLILDPADYALFGIVGAVSAFVAALSQLGSGYVLAHRFPTSRGDARRRLVSTIALQVLATSVLCALLLLAVWPWVRGEWVAVAQIDGGMIALVAAASVGASFYTLLSILAVVGYRADLFALVTVAKATAMVGATLLALFLFDAGVLALFVGQATGEGVALVGAIVLLAPLMTRRLDAKVSGQCLRIGGWTSGAQLAMQARQVIERAVLATASGLHMLGIFTHAQMYQNYAMIGLRPIQQAMTPTMLAEAREGGAVFAQTARVTNIIFLAATTLGVGMAFVGREFIGFITNGKFNDAAPFAALLIAAVLVQFAGRPSFARHYVDGRGRFLSVCNLLAVGGSLGTLVALVPWLGIGAAVIGVFVQFLLFRLLLELHPARTPRLPFQDTGAIIGIVLIVACVGLVEWLPTDGWSRLAMLLVAIGIVAAVYHRTVLDLLGQIRKAIAGHTAA